MDLTTKEKAVFYGVIPIASAVTGAIATVIASRAFGGSDPAGAIQAVVSDPGLTPAAKEKLLALINANGQQFYDLMRSVVQFSFMFLCMGLGYGLFARKS